MNSVNAEQKLSAIVPVGLRYADPEELYAGYKRGLDATDFDYQIIFVLDGPNPKFAAGLDRLMSQGAAITIVKLSRSFGEATALMAGLEHADGDVIVTLPAYHQIDPDDISKLIAGLVSS